MGLDTMEMLLSVEDTFDMEMPEKDAQALRTVGDIIRYVQIHISSGGGRAIWSDQEIDSKIRSIISQNQGIPIDRLKDEARLVEDLGME